jgi:methionyl aminopeptidase
MIYHHKAREYTKELMKPGMAFTIEPILMLNDNYQYIMWNDQWTISAPGVPSAQWEHIILITEEGHEILTLREGEASPFELAKKI